MSGKVESSLTSYGPAPTSEDATAVDGFSAVPDACFPSDAPAPTAPTSAPVWEDPPHPGWDNPPPPPAPQSWLGRLVNASNDELKGAVQTALGPASFGLGVGVVLVKNPVEGVLGLVDLQKTFLMADLYDHATEPLSWKNMLSPGDAVMGLGASALTKIGVLDLQDLKQAHDEREALTQQLGEVMSHPLEYLGSIPGKLRDEYVGKWNEFRELSSKPDLESQFKAGEILGDVLFDVASTVAGVGAAAELATKAPKLLKLGQMLGKEAGALRAAGGVAEEASLASRSARAAKSAAKAEPAAAAAEEGKGASKLAPAEARALVDRGKIRELALAGKIEEARDVLRPFLEAVKTAETPAARQTAMNQLIDRLDLTSSQGKMFWSGNKDLAATIARSKGQTVLEATPGGRVIDSWKELDQAFPWKSGMPPDGSQFWGKVSARYSADLKGSVEVVQTANKFPMGGEVFRQYEFPEIRKRALAGEVKELVLHRIDDQGKVLETLRLDPLADETAAMFGSK